MIQAQQDRGQSIKDFCQTVGISRNAYFYWKKKLRKAACTELAKTEEPGNIVPNGFWLYFKRLERGRFRWPSEGDSATMVLDVNELSCLIDGARLEKKLGRKEVFERQIS